MISAIRDIFINACDYNNNVWQLQNAQADIIMFPAITIIMTCLQKHGPYCYAYWKDPESKK